MEQVLNDDQTTGSIFAMPDGWNLLQVGVTGSNALPTSITLQTRFQDSDGTFTSWQATPTVFSSTYGWQDIVFASSKVQYRLSATASGAVAVNEFVASTRFA